MGPKNDCKHVRPIDVEKGSKVSEMVVHEETKKAITLVICVSSETEYPFTSVEGGFDINAN